MGYATVTLMTPDQSSLTTIRLTVGELSPTVKRGGDKLARRDIMPRTVSVCNCYLSRDKSQKTEPRVIKFGTPDELAESWFGIDFGSKRSRSHGSKVSASESLFIL